MARRDAAFAGAHDGDPFDALSRQDLLVQAQRLGVPGASALTRIELVDEIRRASGTMARGLLGRARELLRGVVERGLARALSPASAQRPALPAGESLATVVDAPPSAPPAPVPTRTLAEVYLAQGHVARARAIVRELLRVNPNDAEAIALLSKMDSKTASKTPSAPSAGSSAEEETSEGTKGDAPAATPEPIATVRSPILSDRAPKVGPEEPEKKPKEKSDVPIAAAARTAEHDDFVDDPYSVDAIEPAAFVEPVGAPSTRPPALLDDEALPERYGVDECVAMSVDATTIYVYWETLPRSVARTTRALGGDASVVRAVLRVLIVEPSEQGPRVSTRDLSVADATLGEQFIRELPSGAVVRAAIGLASGDRFLPIAHTRDVESPPAERSVAIARDVGAWRAPGTARRQAPSPEAVEASVAAVSRAARTATAPVGDDAGRDREDDRDIAADDEGSTMLLSSVALQIRRLRAQRRAAGERGASGGASDRIARAPAPRS